MAIFAVITDDNKFRFYREDVGDFQEYRSLDADMEYLVRDITSDEDIYVSKTVIRVLLESRGLYQEMFIEALRCFFDETEQDQVLLGELVDYRSALIEDKLYQCVCEDGEEIPHSVTGAEAFADVYGWYDEGEDGEEIPHSVTAVEALDAVYDWDDEDEE